MSPIQSLLTEERQLLKSTEVNAAKLSQLQSMLPESRIPSLLGMIGKACSADAMPIWLHEIVVTPELPAEKKPAVQSSARNGELRNGCFGSSMKLRGIAIDNDALSEFIRSLEEFNVFSSVELSTAHESIIDGKSVQEFEMNCNYNE